MAFFYKQFVYRLFVASLVLFGFIYLLRRAGFSSSRLIYSKLQERNDPNVYRLISKWDSTTNSVKYLQSITTQLPQKTRQLKRTFVSLSKITNQHTTSAKTNKKPSTTGFAIPKMQSTMVSTQPQPSSAPTSKKPLYSFSDFHVPQQFLSPDFSTRLNSVKPFEIQISLKERTMMYELLAFFDKTLTDNGIPYMMFGGTLLGSFRHHDLIPWDDDLDVWVNETARPLLAAIFARFSPVYVLRRAGEHDKLYRRDAAQASAYPWRWPYVDVSYFRENGTHIWDISRAYGKTVTYPKTIAFPFHRRPLYTLWLYGPRDTFAALVWTFGLESSCVALGYSHIVEGGGPQGVQECAPLADKYPFVEHFADPGGIREVLRYRGVNMTDMVVEEPIYAVAETFAIKLKSSYKVPSGVILP